MFGGYKLGIRVTAVSVFIFVTFITALVAISLQYLFGIRMAREVAQSAYVQVSESLAQELSSIEKQSTHSVELIAQHPALLEPDNAENIRPLFAQVLQQNPLFYGLYIGRDNGDFYELINLNASLEARQALKADNNDRWVELVISGQGNERKRHFRYFDAQMNLRFERFEATEYDPRQRAWYQQAIAQPELYQTSPYLFAQLQSPGQTIAQQLPNETSVLGMDLLLNSLSGYLQKHGFGQDKGDAFIFQASGNIIATSQNQATNQPLRVPDFTLSSAEQDWIAQQPVLQVSNELNWPPLDYAVAGQPRGYSIELLGMISSMTGLKLNFVNGLSWSELADAFRAGKIDILQSLILTDENTRWGMASQPYVEIPFALAAKNKTTNFKNLNGKKLAVSKGWSVIAEIKKRYPYISIIETDDTLSALKLVQAGSADAAIDNQVILQYLIEYYFMQDVTLTTDVGLESTAHPSQLHLMVQSDQAELITLLNRAISRINHIHQQSLAQKWLSVEAQAQSFTQRSVPSPELINLTQQLSDHGKLKEVQYNNKTYFAYVKPLSAQDNADKYLGVLVARQQVIAPFVEQVLYSIFFSAILLAIMLPFSWWFSEPIVRPVRELARENHKIRQHKKTEVRRIKSYILEIDELSESIVGMVKTIQQKERDQRDLLDSFIKLIAEAIDQKSPYTGGHCARVPELALMLVKEANNCAKPPYKDFLVESTDAWRELRIAAWLHDCGKVTTPEFVVDKGTKLETIHNRIHEIRTRFEVLWRDAEIDYLKQLAEQPEQKTRLLKERMQKRQQLQDDFAFIAECNIGGEFLDDSKKDRLRNLANTRWQRNFNKHLGLAHLEAKRYPAINTQLPANEFLLNDGPEHLIPRPHNTLYPENLGINMEVPKYLYNRGELHNLLVSRGTLTAEDRFKINEHMISTIRMLDALPFPKELSNVPKYASTHHETLDGRGYPRKLTAKDLSIPERMLALADVFEALTAADRPYKKGKTLSQTLKILKCMVEDQHIDGDAFELLLTSGIYKQYAALYLDEGQMDDIDINDYLRPQAKSA